jgi:hypothetical protein
MFRGLLWRRERKFFLLIETAEPKFDENTRSFMEGLNAQEVFDVEE